MPIPELPVGGDFIVDVLNERIPDLERRYMQVVVLGLVGIAAQVVEEVCGIFADLFIGGENAHIGIESGGLVVVISGRQVDITDDPVVMFFYDHCDFAVGLQVGHSVKDVRTGFFQLFCPLHVIFLVETGFQLDKHSDLFAVFGGCLEPFDDRLVFADTVQRLLDGDRIKQTLNRVNES